MSLAIHKATRKFNLRKYSTRSTACDSLLDEQRDKFASSSDRLQAVNHTRYECNTASTWVDKILTTKPKFCSFSVGCLVGVLFRRFSSRSLLLSRSSSMRLRVGYTQLPSPKPILWHFLVPGRLLRCPREPTARGLAESTPSLVGSPGGSVQGCPSVPARRRHLSRVHASLEMLLASSSSCILPATKATLVILYA